MLQNLKKVDKGVKTLEETRVLKMDIYDYKLLINALNEFRNQKIKENIDVEIIDELLMRLLQAPIEKEKFKKEHCISAR